MPHAQQTQHPATPMQITDIISQAAPQQTQSVVIPQQTIVPQQQMGMDPQTSTLHLQQQPQLQIGGQSAELEQQQVTAAQPATEQHQHSLSATSIEKHQSETQQQICVQQSAPHVQPASQQHVFAPQTGMEQRVMQSTGDPCEQIMLQSQQQLQQQQTLLQQQQQKEQQQQVLLLEQHQLYVQQQLDQQQQRALLQQQQQAQLQQQQALKQKQLLDQQQQTLIQQKQEQQQQGLGLQEQPIFQHQLEQQQPKQPPSQQQSQLYQQIGQRQTGTQKETENQQQSGKNEQQILLQQHPQQMQQQNEQQLQQQALIRQMEQQQALIQQQLMLQQQQQLQQKAQLQQQEQQQAQLKQQIEQQQQALLQQQLEQQRQQQVLLQQQAERLQQQALMKQQFKEQQQASIIQLQQTEKHKAVPIPQSNSEQQIHHQPTDIQQMCIPQLNSTQFTPHASQMIEQQQQVALMQQQQQAFVAQPQQHTSVMEPHISVGAPVSTEVIHHQTYIISQGQVPMTIPTTVQTPASVPAQILTQQGQSEAQPQNQGQSPAKFIAQSAAQAPQAMTEGQVTTPLSLIQGHTQVIQSQQVPSQSSYPGPVTPTQSQVTSQPIQAHPLTTTFTQSQPLHGQVPKADVQMMGQQSQTTVQPPGAVASIPSQIQHETLIQQNAPMPALTQPQVQQQTQGQQASQLHAQSAAGPLTNQYVPHSTQQAIPPVQSDITHITQQLEQQHPVIQYQQMILSPGSAGSCGTKTDGLNSVTAPLHPIQTKQAQVPGQRSLHSVVQGDPSVIQSICQPAVSQYTEQYQQQLQKLSHVQQSLAMPPPQTQLPALPSSTPVQQPLPLKPALITFDESQLPSQCEPPSPLMTIAPGQLGPNNVAEPQSQGKTLSLYSHLVLGAPPSPQHHPKQMPPAHTQTQASNQAQAHSQTQIHTQTPISEQPILPHAVFPTQQVPPSPLHTSCPSTLSSLTSLPSTYPAVAPAPELPTSSPAAQVTLPAQVDFIPTSPLPVTTLQSLDSNAPKPKLTQGSLQDCDLSLLGIAQVQEV